MYLRTPGKSVKYTSGDDDSDDEFEVRRPTNSTNNNNNGAAKTQKRKASLSLSDDGAAPVKKEKMKSPTLMKIETDLESSYGLLEKAEKKPVSDRRTKWTEDEFALILLALYRNSDANQLIKFWPMDDFPRSPAVLRKKLADVKADLKTALQINDNTVPVPQPEVDGTCLFSIRVVTCRNQCYVGVAAFACFTRQWPRCLWFSGRTFRRNSRRRFAGLQVCRLLMCADGVLTSSGARFRLTRLPFLTEVGLTTGVQPQFVQFKFPDGYTFVRKYDRAETDVLPIKGFVLRLELDEPAAETDEVEMF